MQLPRTLVVLVTIHASIQKLPLFTHNSIKGWHSTRTTRTAQSTAYSTRSASKRNWHHFCQMSARYPFLTFMHKILKLYEIITNMGFNIAFLFLIFIQLSHSTLFNAFTTLTIHELHQPLFHILSFTNHAPLHSLYQSFTSSVLKPLPCLWMYTKTDNVFNLCIITQLCKCVHCWFVLFPQILKPLLSSKSLSINVQLNTIKKIYQCQFLQWTQNIQQTLFIVFQMLPVCKEVVR